MNGPVLPSRQVAISEGLKNALWAAVGILAAVTVILAISTAYLQFVGLPNQYNAGIKAGELEYPESEPLLVTMVVNLSEAPKGSLLTLNSSVVVESVTFSFSHKVEKCEGGKEEVTVEFKVDVKVDATVNLSVLANETAFPRTFGPDERSITLDIAYDIATGLWMVTERTSPFP